MSVLIPNFPPAAKFEALEMAGVSVERNPALLSKRMLALLG